LLAGLFTRLRRRALELEPRDAYTLWAPSYPAEAHNGFMALEERELLALLPELRGRAALDVGCGSGRYLRHLQGRGAARVAGCDLTPAMLVQARALAPAVAQADAAALPFAPAAFDVVVAGLVVGHCAELRPVIAETARVLRPGGVLLYSDVHPAGTLAGWQRTFRDTRGRTRAARQHLHLYAEHVSACRDAGLAIEELREPRADVPGRWRGWPALLVVRARKPA
jgi:malonyl-CoA O-methyltransferase